MKFQRVQDIINKKLNSKYIIFLIILLCTLIYLNPIILGWYGYGEWKHRRSTFGNKVESLERKVFIKDLGYSTSLDLKEIKIYIERGFKYGFYGSKETQLLKNDLFPYQICYSIKIDTNHIYSYDNNLKANKYDSIPFVYFLKENSIKHPFYIKVSRLSNKRWDSIGCIKVWDKNVMKK